MRYVLSSHASQSLLERGISVAEVDEVLRNPQQVVDNWSGGHCYQSKLSGPGGRIYLLRVIVNDTVNPARVVTAYRTRRISKYWR